MENKNTYFDKYFDSAVLEWQIQLILEDSIPKPYPKDIDNYDELTVIYSNCNSKEQIQTNDSGYNYRQRLYAAIKYNREQSRRNYL
jgi:hypothetical protein